MKQIVKPIKNLKPGTILHSKNGFLKIIAPYNEEYDYYYCIWLRLTTAGELVPTNDFMSTRAQGLVGWGIYEYPKERGIFPILREIVGIIAEDEFVRIENEHGGILDEDTCSDLATTWDEWEVVRIRTYYNGIVVVVREPEDDDDLQE